MTTILVDPTSELSTTVIPVLPRLSTLVGATIGLLDISKARGDIFLDRVEALLIDAGASVKRYTKPNFTRISPTAIKQQIAAECDAVVEALAD